MKNQKGVALVLVLWVLSLLMIMAGSFALTMRRETTVAAVIKNNAEAKAVAESGIAIAEKMLLNSDINKAWKADGSIYEILANHAKIRIRLEAETGKIDLNKADPVLLQKLMVNAPVDEEFQSKLVGAILDWRDADDLVNLNGAEKAEYQDAGLSYEPRNKPFESVEELQLVLGMDKTVFSWLEPLVTVNSGQPQVDLQLATKEVLKTISGMDAEMIEAFVLARIDNARNNLPPPPLPLASGLQRTASGKNNIVTIISEAFLAGDSKARLHVVVEKPEGNDASSFQVLKWQHATPNNKSLFSDVMSELLVKQYAEPELNN